MNSIFHFKVATAPEEWREGSGSPSESNSSAEWTPPSLGSRMAAFALLSGEEEARTGEHPVALQPPVKEFVLLNLFVNLLKDINIAHVSKTFN